MKGKFITLEGIEGSGKSTSLEDIANTLDQKSIDYILTKEPGSGSLGKDLRSLLLSNENQMSGQVELLLMMADRKNHLDTLVIPNLDSGNWVISDRYLDSTYAYYRCSFQGSLQLDRINTKSSELLGIKIKPPCLYFHGKNDGCIDYKLADGMQDFFENLEVEILDGCGHFLHLEKTDEFNNKLLSFFADS